VLAFQGGGGPGSAQPRLGELAAAGGQGLAEAGPVDAGDGLEGGQRVLQPAQRAVPGRRRFGHRVSCGAGGGGAARSSAAARFRTALATVSGRPGLAGLGGELVVRVAAAWVSRAMSWG